MVRKRPHRYYESDDDDSDSDFGGYAANARSDPAPKRYSLRTRQKTTFVEEFDYNFEASDESERLQSSDEEFCLEPENESFAYGSNDNTLNQIEEETSQIEEDENGLIDFEDIIRADIVINKNRIDYDNAINKSEIGVQDSESRKRGRSSKDSQKCTPAPQVTVTELGKNILVPGKATAEKKQISSNDKTQTVTGNVNGIIVGNKQENGLSKATTESQKNLTQQNDINSTTEIVAHDDSDNDDDDCILIVEKHDIIVLDDD